MATVDVAKGDYLSALSVLKKAIDENKENMKLVAIYNKVVEMNREGKKIGVWVIVSGEGNGSQEGVFVHDA